MERPRFNWQDPAARQFYDEHGFVVVSGVLTNDECEAVGPAWDEIVAEAAEAADVAPNAFVELFPQNRDLWSKSATFKRLLFESNQGQVARHFLGTEGARLFHDHGIAKPSGRSGTIPWHQDSTYWPLDRVGNSLWTPTATVPANGGCLKVLDGSHLDGPGTPQDFLRPDGIDRDADSRLIYVPVSKGETVVLHGLTWHSSEPNTATVDRLAYLTLWVPATARFTPEHAGWHPTAAHIDSAPGERLEGDWFPLFGQVAEQDEGESVSFEPPTPGGEGPTMFKASEAIKRHLRWLAGEPDALLPDLVSPQGREVLEARAVALGLVAQDELGPLRSVLANLALQERIRERFVARDVYLSVVQAWWHLLGHRVDERSR